MIRTFDYYLRTYVKEMPFSENKKWIYFQRELVSLTNAEILRTKCIVWAGVA